MPVPPVGDHEGFPRDIEPPIGCRVDGDEKPEICHPSGKLPPVLHRPGELLLKGRTAEVFPFDISGEITPTLLGLQDIQIDATDLGHYLRLAGKLLASDVDIQIAQTGDVIREDLFGEESLQLLGYL